MKKLILLLLITFSTSFYAQNARVEFNKNSELFINAQLVNNQTTFAKIVELLGQPELVKESKSGVKNYTYANQGIAFKVYNDKLTMIGFNYNWDGDKNFPSTSFTGVAVIGSVQLDNNTNKEFMKKIDFAKFELAFMDVYIAKALNNAIMVGFKNDKITQISFEFKPE
ncbi:DUF7738 domain-containing protein [Flavobacterium terrigena]|uniref:DUF7738 domain-containing protein n=1 Tax=Flavobacterium terrigena TaxID=402734 RepID=A0A1H6R3X6_9FLAO|nr:hypothetical protein [Flavobacterium terrigena]SEI45892.1 hypothetical protein SAMN05660918_0688 [Flavobacterium terrigena]